MFKVALFGGAFNPITVGHVETAQFVLRHSDIQEVWITPCFLHKYGKNMVKAEHRLEMVKLAVEDIPNIRAFDYEIIKRLEGATYDFVKRLLNDFIFQACSFKIVVGVDNANNITKWVKHKQLREIVPFIVVPRKGSSLNKNGLWCNEPPHTNLTRFENTMPEVSSTQIREAFARGDLDFCRTMLAPKVFQYTQENNLYLQNSKE